MPQKTNSQKKFDFVDEVLQEINNGVVATAAEYYGYIKKYVP